MIISPQRHEGTKVHEVFYYLVRHQDTKVKKIIRKPGTQEIKNISWVP
jgi:hypothetical protein